MGLIAYSLISCMLSYSQRIIFFVSMFVDIQSSIHHDDDQIDGVGKSSLISTYISGIYTNTIQPGILTRVQIPTFHPTITSSSSSSSDDDDHRHNIITTIIDTHQADEALVQMISLQKTYSTTTTTTIAATTHQQQSLSSTLLPPPPLPPRSHDVADDTNVTTTTTSCHDIMNIDSIILVYDTNRDETFQRLEHHWLPLIETCYYGKVRLILSAFV
jgi:GTPase SAR1 family protein